MSNEKQKLLTEEYLKFILETFFDGVSMSDLYKVLTEFKKETGKSPLNWVIRIKKENHILGLPLRFINEGDNPILDSAFNKGKCNFGIAGEFDSIKNHVHLPGNETIN